MSSCTLEWSDWWSEMEWNGVNHQPLPKIQALVGAMHVPGPALGLDGFHQLHYYASLSQAQPPDLAMAAQRPHAPVPRKSNVTKQNGLPCWLCCCSFSWGSHYSHLPCGYTIQEKVRKGKYLVIYQHRPERRMVGAKYMTGHEHRISGRKSQPSPWLILSFRSNRPRCSRFL